MKSIIPILLLTFMVQANANCTYTSISDQLIDRSAERAEYKRNWIENRLMQEITESTLYYEGKAIEKRIAREYYILEIDKNAPKDTYEINKTYGEGSPRGPYFCNDGVWERR